MKKIKQVFYTPTKGILGIVDFEDFYDFLNINAFCTVLYEDDSYVVIPHDFEKDYIWSEGSEIKIDDFSNKRDVMRYFGNIDRCKQIIERNTIFYGDGLGFEDPENFAKSELLRYIQDTGIHASNDILKYLESKPTSPNKSDLYNIPIEHLELPVRTLNICQSANLSTVGDIIRTIRTGDYKLSKYKDLALVFIGLVKEEKI